MRIKLNRTGTVISLVSLITFSLTSCGLKIKKDKDESHPSSSNVASQFSSVVTFGDSLSDTGNVKYLTGKLAGAAILKRAIPISPEGENSGYYAGRFSNDKIWIDQLLSTLNIEAKDSETCLTRGSNSSCNYAFGGSTTDESISSDKDYIKNLFNQPEVEKIIGKLDLTVPQHFGIKQMVDSYLSFSKPSQDVVNHTLYVIWGGGNDYMAGDKPENVVSHLISSMESILNYSTDNQKVYFMIPNLPDISKSPYGVIHNDKDYASLTKEHNILLKKEIAAQITDNPKYKEKAVVILVDVAKAYTDILEQAEQYGFTNTTKACFEGGYLPDNNSKDCGDSKNYIYWDDIHPTSHTHCEIAKTALEAMASSNLLDNPEIAHNFKCE